ncbi:hypothetical protein PBSA08_030 [Staphylococcus phage PBSA08]|nr:hypothetical protein PBSA08_030 [Staphylococcus phage PBSA08]WJZ48726.1 hypothetical protein SAC_95 [Staphylococcus phage SAC]
MDTLSIIALTLLIIIIVNTTMNFVGMLRGERDLVKKGGNPLPNWQYYNVLLPNLCGIILLGIVVYFGDSIYKITTRIEVLFAIIALIVIDVLLTALVLLVLSFVTKNKE